MDNIDNTKSLKERKNDDHDIGQAEVLQKDSSDDKKKNGEDQKSEEFRGKSGEARQMIPETDSLTSSYQFNSRGIVFVGLERNVIEPESLAR